MNREYDEEGLKRLAKELLKDDIFKRKLLIKISNKCYKNISLDAKIKFEDGIETEMDIENNKESKYDFDIKNVDYTDKKTIFYTIYNINKASLCTDTIGILAWDIKFIIENYLYCNFDDIDKTIYANLKKYDKMIDICNNTGISTQLIRIRLLKWTDKIIKIHKKLK